MTTEHLNLQPVKTSKIFGVLKMGANNTDQKVIRMMQLQGYDEFEIQSRAGVHYLTVRSFMQAYNPNFVETPVPPTPETQHLHDRIAELEKEKAKQQTPVTEVLERLAVPYLNPEPKPEPKPKAKSHKKKEKPPATTAAAATATATGNDY